MEGNGGRAHQQDDLDVLRGLCHAFGSATTLSDATASTLSWASTVVGREAGVRVTLPDRAGRLRVAALSGDGSAAGRKRSRRRRAAFESKRPALIDVPRPPGTALALLPLVSRGEAVGVLEVSGPKETLQARLETLIALASQAAILVGNVQARQRLERQVESLRASAELVGALEGSWTLEQAVRSTMRLCSRFINGPVAAWVVQSDPSRLSLLHVRGLGSRKRAKLREALGSLPRWDRLNEGQRQEICALFTNTVQSQRVAVIDAHDAVILAGCDDAGSMDTLDTWQPVLRGSLRGQRALDRAQRRSERMDLGLAWTAHEVRAPLLGAMAAMECLLEEAVPEVSGRDLLSRSREELGQLAGIVEALLRWSVGEGPLHSRPTDLVALVREAVNSCDFEEGSARIRVSAPEELVVSGDSDQLRSAVANLIRNALAYSPPQSDVRVSVERSNGTAQLSVSDRGPGVPVEERDTIFDPFARGHVGQTSRNGRGLGLFIAKRVVEAHGGQIWLEGPNSGATFRVQLPVNGGGKHARPHY
jgi:signal transduction histidine kinase